MKGALRMTLSLERFSLCGHEGGDLCFWCSVGQTGVGSSTWDFERWLKGALEVGHFYGSSMKGTWREGSLAGDPRG